VSGKIGEVFWVSTTKATSREVHVSWRLRTGHATDPFVSFNCPPRSVLRNFQRLVFDALINRAIGNYNRISLSPVKGFLNEKFHVLRVHLTFFLTTTYAEEKTVLPDQ
jgi:hypothetical protein